MKLSKERIKGVIMGALVTAILCNGLPVLAAAVQKNILVSYNGMKVYVDGKEITPKDSNGNVVEPMIYQDTAYLPLKSVLQQMGLSYAWNAKTNNIHISSTPDKSVIGDKAKIIEATTGSGTDLYRNYWNKAMPFKVDDIKYEQNNIYGVKLNIGSIDDSFKTWGLRMSVDNSDLDYSTVKFTVAADDFSKTFSISNKIYIRVEGTSKALGNKLLYSSTQGREGGTVNHEADITGFENISIYIYAYSSFNSYYTRYYRNEDYILVFEPTMHK